MKNYKIGLSFANDDIACANQLIDNLSDLGFIIYTDSKKISKEILDKKTNFIVIVENENSKNLLDEIDICININTPNFQKNKWQGYKCPILENSIAKQKIIIPCNIGKKTQPIFTIPNHFTPLNIENPDSNTIVNYCVSKIKLFDDALISNYHGITDNFKELYPNHSIEKLEYFHNEKGNEIGYKFYTILNPANSKKDFYLFLPGGIIYQKTYDYLCSRNFSNNGIIINGSFTLIIVKRKDSKDIKKQKDYVSKLFGTKQSTYTTEEFNWLFGIPENFKSHELRSDISFVEPFINIDHVKERVFNFLNDKLISEEPTTFIIFGDGGIGKTTLVKKIADVWEKKTEAKAIHIQAEKLSKSKILDQTNIIDMYSLYSLDPDFEKEGKINLAQFNKCFDNGNLLIIIDGLDEIANYSGKLFNMISFLETINKFNWQNKHGKVILTCRKFFWETIKSDLEFSIKQDLDKPEHVSLISLELLPFDIELTKEYLSHFFKNKALIDNGITILKNFHNRNNQSPTNNNNLFIPFVIDVVRYILESAESKESFEDHEFDSRILNKSYPDDYIIGKICQRESLKKSKINIDNQIQFFINLSAIWNGIIQENQINKLLSESLEAEFALQDIQWLKSHPLLIFIDDTIRYKYSFLNEFFKGIYLFVFITKYPIVFNSNVIHILNNDIKNNPYFTFSICKRLHSYWDKKDDSGIMQILELIEEIKKYDFKNFYNNEKYPGIREQNISSAFAIALYFNILLKNNTIENNTTLLKDVFGKSTKKVADFKLTEIENLYLMEIPKIESMNVKFDFSNLTFKYCVFSGFDNFWECKFGKNTIFDSCYFRNLQLLRGGKTDAESFMIKNNCDVDSTITEVLHEKYFENTLLIKKIISDLKTFFKKFFIGTRPATIGNYEIENYFYKSLTVNKILSTLISNNIIIIEKSRGRKGETHATKYYSISSDFSRDISNFIDNGTMSMNVRNIIDLFLDEQTKKLAKEEKLPKFQDKEKKDEKGMYPGDTTSAIKKGKEVLKLLHNSNISLDNYCFVSLGGGDGTELIYELTNSNASMGLLIEKSQKFIDIAQEKINQFVSTNPGKIIEIIRADINDPNEFDTIEYKLNILKKRQKINGIVVSIHAVLHELPTRSSFQYIPANFFSRITKLQHGNLILIIREPGKVSGPGWGNNSPVNIIVKFDDDYFKLKQAATQVKIRYFLSGEFESFDHQKRIFFHNENMAIEALFILFYWEDFDYEINELHTSVDFLQTFQILTQLDFNISTTTFLSDSFKENVNKKGIIFNDKNLSVLMPPDCFSYFFCIKQ